MKQIILLLGIFPCFLNGYSQHNHEEETEHSLKAPFHKITLITANSIVTNNVTENSSGIFVIPTFGLNYDYFFKERWGIGIHTDVVLSQFKVERHHDGKELVRQNPAAVTGVVSFKPNHRWTLLGGYGVELEKHENIVLFKFGIEYGISLRDNWELEIGFEYDHKIDAFSSFVLGLGFSKILGKHR